jgi:hypothetical protein
VDLNSTFLLKIAAFLKKGRKFSPKMIFRIGFGPLSVALTEKE